MDISSAPPTDPTKRFTDRVADYIDARPSYPDELVDRLVGAGRLRQGAVVADVGSGTGISTELFLRHGFEVYAVEPNQAMRQAADLGLSALPGFHSVDGTAEATTLSTASVDLVACGQAFHWFDKARARAEFRRVLRDDGSVALFWNKRRTDTTPFLRAYEGLLERYAVDYAAVRHRNVSRRDLEAFFGAPFDTWSIPTAQRCDLAALRARLLSSSYTPPEGHPNRQPLLEALIEVFQEFQEFQEFQDDGSVTIDYDTELYAGPMA